MFVDIGSIHPRDLFLMKGLYLYIVDQILAYEAWKKRYFKVSAYNSSGDYHYINIISFSSSLLRLSQNIRLTGKLCAEAELTAHERNAINAPRKLCHIKSNSIPIIINDISSNYHFNIVSVIPMDLVLQLNFYLILIFALILVGYEYISMVEP